MKKIILLLTSIFLMSNIAFAQETYTLKAGVSLDSIPKELYGTWRVSSKLLSSNNEENFKKNNVDLWNLSRSGNVITLDNPFSGAHACIMVDEVKGHFIRFKKVDDYQGQKLTDSVELNLDKETFVGVNNVKLDTISEVDGHVIKSKWAVFSLKGEKISGDSIQKE